VARARARPRCGNDRCQRGSARRGAARRCDDDDDDDDAGGGGSGGGDGGDDGFEVTSRVKCAMPASIRHDAFTVRDTLSPFLSLSLSGFKIDAENGIERDR